MYTFSGGSPVGPHLPYSIGYMKWRLEEHFLSFAP